MSGPVGEGGLPELLLPGYRVRAQVHGQGARGARRLPLRKLGPRTRRYGSALRSALKVCWRAPDYLCSLRLHPYLPDLVLIPR